MNLPDIIGFSLEEATSVLENCGFIISEVHTTKPVNAIEPLGMARVVRITDQGDAKLQLVVAYEDYLKGGV